MSVTINGNMGPVLPIVTGPVASNSGGNAETAGSVASNNIFSGTGGGCDSGSGCGSSSGGGGFSAIS